MKTATTSFRVQALKTVLGASFALFLGLHPAGAADSAGPITSTVPGPISPTAASASPALPPSIALPSASSSDAAKAKDPKKAESDIPAPSPKVPDSVKNVINHLNNATQDVTLEDLNSAREAVVKLDVLIDIEKRLNDLAGLRREREEKNATAVAAALPASALGLSRPGVPSLPMAALPTMPVTPSLLPTAPKVVAPVVPPGPVAVDVLRITGSRGNYSALLRESGGSKDISGKDSGAKDKRVRAGDKLSDGTEVRSISKNGVTLVKDKKTRTIQVKDVEQVFGSR